MAGMGETIFLACVGILTLLTAGMLLSVDQIEQNEYGLVFNWVTKKIRNEVYHGGTHFIGAWNTFVTFPATVQTIEFSDRLGHNAMPLHTRTKEGLALHLSISFQYKLNPDDLPKLYALTNDQYNQLYIRLARDQLLEAAAEYEGPQYWQERQTIGAHMRGLVDASLKKSYASLWGLQLLIIDLPDQFEDSITKTQVQKQTIMTKENEQVSTGIRADTEVLTADFDRQIRVVQAGADANFSLVTKLAKAEAQKRRINAESAMLGYVRDKLKLTAGGVVQYQQLNAYANLPNANFLANVLGATPVLGVGAQAAPSVAVGLMNHGRQVQNMTAWPAESDVDQTLKMATQALNQPVDDASHSSSQRAPKSANAFLATHAAGKPHF